MSPTAGMKSGINGFSFVSNSIVCGVYLQCEVAEHLNEWSSELENTVTHGTGLLNLSK